MYARINNWYYVHVVNALIRIVENKWPELDGRMIPVADQEELFQRVNNNSRSDSLCFGGSAGS